MKKKTKILTATVFASQAILVAPAFATEEAPPTVTPKTPLTQIASVATTSADTAAPVVNEAPIKVLPLEATVTIIERNTTAAVAFTQNEFTYDEQSLFNLTSYLKVTDNNQTLNTLDHLDEMRITFYQSIDGEKNILQFSSPYNSPGQYSIRNFVEGEDIIVEVSLNDSKTTATLKTSVTPKTTFTFTGFQSEDTHNNISVDIIDKNAPYNIKDSLHIDVIDNGAAANDAGLKELKTELSIPNYLLTHDKYVLFNGAFLYGLVPVNAQSSKNQALQTSALTLDASFSEEAKIYIEIPQIRNDYGAIPVDAHDQMNLIHGAYFITVIDNNIAYQYNLTVNANTVLKKENAVVISDKVNLTMDMPKHLATNIISVREPVYGYSTKPKKNGTQYEILKLSTSNHRLSLTLTDETFRYHLSSTISVNKDLNFKVPSLFKVNATIAEQSYKKDAILTFGDYDAILMKNENNTVELSSVRPINDWQEFTYSAVYTDVNDPSNIETFEVMEYAGEVPTPKKAGTYKLAITPNFVETVTLEEYNAALNLTDGPSTPVPDDEESMNNSSNNSSNSSSNNDDDDTDSDNSSSSSSGGSSSNSSSGSSSNSGGSVNSSSNNQATPITPPNTAPVIVDIPQTGNTPVEIAVPKGQEAFAQHVEKVNVEKVSGKYKVTVIINPKNGLKQFVVTQKGKVIKTWTSQTAKLASIKNLLPFATQSNELTFDVDSLDDITFEAITDKETFTATVNEKAEAPTPVETVTPKTNPFTDIANTGNVDEIVALYHAGIINGTSATTYSPGKPISRGQFAAMIARALELAPANKTHFTDIQGKWFEQDVQALYEAGIINGTSATTFEPGKNITRQQAAKMIVGMLEYRGYKPTAKAPVYKDAHKISDYAKAPFAELQQQNVMTGNNGYIEPGAPLTRAQMAKVLKRALDLVSYDFN